MSQLPQNIDAEQSVLGALMHRPEALAKVSDWLDPAMFVGEGHRLIYTAIIELVGKGAPVDCVTLGEWFEREGIAELVGGVSYILHLQNTTMSAANIVAYAEIVVEKSRLRRAIDIGAELQRKAMEPKVESGLAIADAAHQLAQLQNTTTRGGLEPVRGGLKEWFANLSALYERGESVTGLPTPWKDLNDATHGLQNGELVVVGGRPNMGKSIVGDSMGLFVALREHNISVGHDKSVALFALETTRDKVVRRAVSRIGGVPHDWLVAPNAASEEDTYWHRISAATASINDAHLLVDDTAGLSVHQIVARCRRAHLQRPIGLVVIDHLHLIARPGKDKPHIEIGAITRALKALAKELHCPVIALGQLNRSVTKGADHRPTMADLRESGDIEQDADLILLIHREDYYSRDTHLQGVVELEIAKGRDVPTGTRIHLRNEYAYMRLADWEGPLPQAPQNVPPQRKSGWAGKKGSANRSGEN